MVGSTNVDRTAKIGSSNLKDGKTLLKEAFTHTVVDKEDDSDIGNSIYMSEIDLDNLSPNNQK